jgi:hypothetical protein
MWGGVARLAETLASHRRQRPIVLVQLRLRVGWERMVGAAGCGVGTLLGPERTTHLFVVARKGCLLVGVVGLVFLGRTFGEHS